MTLVQQRVCVARIIEPTSHSCLVKSLLAVNRRLTTGLKRTDQDLSRTTI